MDLQVPRATLDYNAQPCRLQNSSSLDYGHPRGIVLPVVPRSGTRHWQLHAGIYHREDIWSPWEGVKHPWIAQEPTTQASASPFPAIVHYTCPNMKLLHLLLPPFSHGYLPLPLFLPVVFGADADHQQRPPPPP
ncbi:hypothetical protein E4U60_006232 [Claviceps pazoutovae]|uniref:Uncharacterized protein n=1 Tax=Claviceps pazoutovae TaxID=1649127 RepID=A0A9P7SLS6_9HYPO|nr:hypothetical protein E4U60_006232 [Claviceps pazoutovae]